MEMASPVRSWQVLAILSIPPLIPAGFRGFRPESRNSAEFQEFRRIPAGIDRNPT